MPSVIELDLVDLRAPSLAEMQSASGELNISSSPVIEMDLMDGIQIEWEIAGLGGPPGPQGPAGTIVVGSTTTGDPGTDAEVTNSGTSEAAILDFVVPRGDKGDQGDSGGFYRHVQATADISWVVNHDLGYRPSVSVEDSAGTVWIPSGIEYIDENTLRIDFDIPFSGYANCS